MKTRFHPFSPCTPLNPGRTDAPIRTPCKSKFQSIGFTGAKRGGHAFGGPAAIAYAGYENSDIENGKTKQNAPPAQLYDLEKDPQQTTNLYREHSDVAAELSALLKQYARNPPTRRSAKAKAKN